MKKYLASLFALSLSFSVVACAQEDGAELKGASTSKDSVLNVTLADPIAGVDYPTDAPFPKALEGKLILRVGLKGIVVPSDALLETPKAGVDYPTDSPIPTRLKDVKVLVLTETVRLPLRLETAKAGIDFPTDSAFDNTTLVWDLGRNQRVILNHILSIEPAKAGIDFPTDGPARLDRDFWVFTSYGKDFWILRTPIAVTRAL